MMNTIISHYVRSYRKTNGGRGRKMERWTDEQLKQALAIVDGVMSTKQASNMYHIPYSTFC